MKKATIFVSQGPFVNEQFADISSAIDAVAEWTKGSPCYPCRVSCAIKVAISDPDLVVVAENDYDEERDRVKCDQFVVTLFPRGEKLRDKWGDNSVAEFVLKEEYLRKALAYVTSNEVKLRPLWLALKRAEDASRGEAKDKDVYRTMYDEHFVGVSSGTKTIEEVLEILLSGIKSQRVGNVFWDYKFGNCLLGGNVLCAEGIAEEGDEEEDEEYYRTVRPKALSVKNVFYKNNTIKIRVGPTSYLNGSMRWRLQAKNGTPIEVFAE